MLSNFTQAASPEFSALTADLLRRFETDLASIFDTIAP